MELFQQTGPVLGNQFENDLLLQNFLHSQLSPESYQDIQPSLNAMGELAGGELYQLQLQDRLNEPVLTQWDPWGKRIDRIEVSPLWKRAESLAAEFGLIAIPYETKWGAGGRIFQFALAYLFTASNDIYSCPLAMTDGAARTLLSSGNQVLIDRALPHLTSRDPAQFWTSGQWMTELPGGSDVGLTETVARYEAGQWRLYGRKWFTSATTSQMTLTLARPEGNGPGGKGLALFYLETRDEAGLLKQIEVCRLKDKLGTRKVPTAELLLHGTPAELVVGQDNGVKNITPMLNITRTWNSISALSLMRRGLVLAEDYATRRIAFGAKLSEKPLHRQTLNFLWGEFAGAFHLTFATVELLGQVESEQATPEQEAMLRFLTPITKLTTGKQAVAFLSEILECFGGAGYVEDTGLPALFRDAQVLPIWEGTTNVLSLDTLRTLGSETQAALILETIQHWAAQVKSDELQIIVNRAIQEGVLASFQWLGRAFQESQTTCEAGARHFALNLGRALEVICLARQIEKMQDQDRATYYHYLRYLDYHSHYAILGDLPIL